MKKHIIFALVAASAAWASAQTVMFDTSVFDRSGGGALTTFSSSSPQITADDATLATPGIITSLEIEFGYIAFGGANATADATFSIWSDNAGSPDSPLWSSGVTNLSFAPATFAIEEIFHVVPVPVPNVSVDSKLYWAVEIANLVEPAGAGSFGLARNQELNPGGNPVGNHVAGTDTIYDSIWADLDTGDGISFTEANLPSQVDPLSVRIFGVAVPEPSMAGLFFIGLASLGLIRKLKTM